MRQAWPGVGDAIDPTRFTMSSSMGIYKYIPGDISTQGWTLNMHLLHSNLAKFSTNSLFINSSLSNIEFNQFL